MSFNIIHTLYLLLYLNYFFIQDESNNSKPKCYLRGLILRSQLIVLLENKSRFDGPLPNYWGSVTMETFRQDYPRYSSIEVSKLN